jgi:ureidoacrylate peracid hydrolase
MEERKMRIINGVEVLTSVEELVEPQRSAVVVIDMVNLCMQKMTSFEGKEKPKSGASMENLTKVIPPVQRLIGAAREKGVFIVYAEFVQRTKLGVPLQDGPNIYCHKNAPELIETVEGSWQSRTVDELAPRQGDLVIYKTRGSVMYRTPLDDILRTRRIRNMILTGILSTGCVLFSACDAMHHGYYPVIPRECVGTYDQGDHERIMSWMETKFPVIDMSEILTAWQLD